MIGRRVQAEWRRERLLDAALSVFVDKGIDGASVKDITTAAGVTPGLLYHYFESKDELVLTLIKERGFLPELRRLVAGPSTRPAAEVLPELVRGFDRVLAEHSELVALFFSASRGNRRLREELQALMEQGQRMIADYLAARVAAGDLRQHDTRTAAQMLVSTVVQSRVIGPRADLSQAVDVFLAGVATARPAVGPDQPDADHEEG